MKDHSAPDMAWGATPLSDSAWSFCVWSPDATDVTLRLPDRDHKALPTQDGWFAARLSAAPGTPYQLVIDGKEMVDPAARWLDSSDGPARLLGNLPPVAPAPIRTWEEVVVLEIHIGTFTDQGTFAAAAARMAEIAALGITAIEIMPIGAFPGQRGWGYDPAFLFAPHPAYGTPEDLALLVSAAHEAGLLVILDVVYNHFGPQGVTIGDVAPHFFSSARETPWGRGIDFAEPAVRAFFIENACMWVADYQFDGLRLDAVHHIVDDSAHHLLDELAATLRDRVPDREVFLIAEDDRNLPDLRERGTITANWNDDYHHAVHCLLTGEDESYYASFARCPIDDLAVALAEGHVEQGQPRPPKTERRGAPVGHLSPLRFVNANQTHDQVGNRAQGERLISLTSADAARIAHALLLCSPAIPMLFMGEEEGARAPFLFFADFDGELADAVRKGRAAEFAGFSQMGGDVPDPISPATFEASRPYANPAADAPHWREMTQLCLRFRAAAIVPLLKSGRTGPAEIRNLGACALHARWPFAAGTLESVVHLGEAPPSPVTLSDAGVHIGAPDHPYHFAARVIGA